MKCVLLFLECHTIEICMDGFHTAQGINQINQRAFLRSPKDNSCSSAAQGYYSGLHCPWPSAWVMYTQLTLVIYYSTLCILTSTILFHCHEELFYIHGHSRSCHTCWVSCMHSFTDWLQPFRLSHVASYSFSILLFVGSMSHKFLWVFIVHSDFLDNFNFSVSQGC
jgi:hypothetical protein